MGAAWSSLGPSNFDYDGVENVKNHPKRQGLEDTDLPMELKSGLKRLAKPPADGEKAAPRRGPFLSIDSSGLFPLTK